MTYSKLNSSAELTAFAEASKKTLDSYRARVLICATGCRALGAVELGQAFRDKLAETGLEDEVAVVETGCHGQCSRAPLVLIEPEEYLYGGVKPDDVAEIVDETLVNGRVVERLCAGTDGDRQVRFSDVPFYKGQQREVLANCGRIDPTKIDDAVAKGCYEGAAKALTSMQPEDVIETMVDAGLRGRGGAGFPAGIKWRFCRNADGDEKYLVCNADEGDPGAFMDRALLEGTPHQVVEGMIIAAYAIGASRGMMYVRAEYPIAVEHIGIALDHARACGLLGDNILGSGFSFDIEVRMGAGAFVCGEETALIASLEGARGMPRSRPPFPAVSGYKGKPTSINNVETLANVPKIILNGSEWYKSIGTEGSKGTKIFALAGKVNDTGLVEVPIGSTLRDIVFDIGGGLPKGREFKAAQMGGPSGGCVPSEFLDLPIDYDSVQKIGAIMGSGGLVVMDDKTCMVDVARFFLDFTQHESCGKCVPCRVGTRHMVDILTRICDGKGEAGDIDKLHKLASTVKSASLCGLGQTAPNPVLTTIRYFRDEYDAHIKDHRCPAGVCRALLSYRVDDEICIKCGRCKKACPAGAVTGEKGEPHEIDVLKCVRCGMCVDACPVDAITVT
jgi:NADH:ubiquinone oxidoreductase subunit F (NADH-binding)/(2Fe-2S) ferredoxin/Pyruvate/2-oxoacid:ferredoxin oxidoreductase delta subunit